MAEQSPTPGPIRFENPPDDVPLAAIEALAPYRDEESAAAREVEAQITAALADHSPRPEPLEETRRLAIERQKLIGTELVGFEDDRDFAGMWDEQLVPVFGQGILTRCLISSITYYADSVRLSVNGVYHVVPSEAYESLVAEFPQLAGRRLRAFGMSNYNEQEPFIRAVEATPMCVYSFKGEKLDDKSYLPDGDDVPRMRIYKLGTIVHEVAHYIWDNVLTPEQRQEWIGLNGPNDAEQRLPLTAYAARYVTDTTPNTHWYGEQFAEAVRLQATNRAYFRQQSKVLANFIAANLPYLRTLNLPGCTTEPATVR